MKKRAQTVFGMSFGVIFSILIIAFIIAVGSYVVLNFWGLGECSKLGIFVNNLEDEIDRAWNSEIYQDVFDETLPEEIEKVCFGDLNIGCYDCTTQNELKAEYFPDLNERNLWFLPEEKACDGDAFSKKLPHIKVKDDRFFCVAPDTKNKIKVKLEKTTADAQVIISP